jgi:hypothetical protein
MKASGFQLKTQMPHTIFMRWNGAIDVQNNLEISEASRQGD